MPSSLRLPVQPYSSGGYHFGQRLSRRVFLWATHLGDDVLAEPGTPVCAIGEGEVVWSEMRLGSEEKRNWGGIVIVRHQSLVASHQSPATSHEAHFYSIYGHITNLKVSTGERVQPGQTLGIIALGSTPENGWWKTPHLHFAIYTGPWKNAVLPGYARPDDWLRLSPRRTRRSWWHNPQEFIRHHNDLDS